jgi:hypothetical protein
LVKIFVLIFPSPNFSHLTSLLLGCSTLSASSLLPPSLSLPLPPSLALPFTLSNFSSLLFLFFLLAPLLSPLPHSPPLHVLPFTPLCFLLSPLPLSFLLAPLSSLLLPPLLLSSPSSSLLRINLAHPILDRLVDIFFIIPLK